MKVTKKQRKLLNGPNAMVRNSLNCKNKVGRYVGRTPVYRNKAKITEVANFVKVQVGIPFVNPKNFGLD